MPGESDREINRSGEYLSGEVAGKLGAFMDSTQKSIGIIHQSLQSIAQRLDEGGRDMAVITNTLTRVEKRTDEHSDRISSLHRALNDQEKEALAARTSEALRRQLEEEYEARIAAVKREYKGATKEARGVADDGSSWVWHFIQKRILSILVGGILAALGTAIGMGVNSFFQTQAQIAAQATHHAAAPAAAPPTNTP